MTEVNPNTVSTTPNRIREYIQELLAHIDRESPWLKYVGKVNLVVSSVMLKGQFVALPAGTGLFAGTKPLVALHPDDLAYLRERMHTSVGSIEDATLAALIWWFVVDKAEAKS